VISVQWLEEEGCLGVSVNLFLDYLEEKNGNECRATEA
jgi:hypothetical protein